MNDVRLHARAPGPDDLGPILTLFQEAFGKRMSPDHYRWKLQTRPSPAANIVIVVDGQNRPVFHSAGIPCRCRLGGAERWIMLGADVMTHPAYRRRGLNTRYSAEMYARWRDAGVALVLGFTNEQWGSSAQKVGLRRLGPLAALVLPLRPERMLARSTGVAALARTDVIGRLWKKFMVDPLPHDESLLVEDVQQPGRDFDDLWADATGGIQRSLVRDRAWVSWRYCDSPDLRYRLMLARRGSKPVGYAAFTQPARGRATIAEIFAAGEDPAVFERLLQAILEVLRHNDVEVVRTLAAPGSWPYRAFRRSGFIVRSRGVIEHIPLDSSLSAEEIGEVKDWYFTAGDFDAV